MVTKSRQNVEVGDTETEIIESTATNSFEPRTFNVGNGENEIEITAWGSSDEENWVKIESKNVTAFNYGGIILGLNHHFYIKLTGKTTLGTGTSIVDGYLIYTEP